MTSHDTGTDLVAIGVIGKAFGIKGELKVTPFGRSLESLDPPCSVLVGPAAETARERILTDIRDVSGRIACRFEGIDDRTVAETLCGQQLFCRQDELPKTGADEFYHFELEGMTVCSGTPDVPYGTVRAVENHPTLDALDVVKTDGSEILLPFTPEMIQRVDKEKRIIIINPDVLGDL